jgi:hypothetical protein
MNVVHARRGLAVVALVLAAWPGCGLVPQSLPPGSESNGAPGSDQPSVDASVFTVADGATGGASSGAFTGSGSGGLGGASGGEPPVMQNEGDAGAGVTRASDAGIADAAAAPDASTASEPVDGGVSGDASAAAGDAGSLDATAEGGPVPGDGEIPEDADNSGDATRDDASLDGAAD